MKTTEGKCGIKATVICDSVSVRGNRLTTLEIEYPRMIHSEFMTHRVFSRNAASSRAIPAAKMAKQLTARPVRFGANVSGMQDGGEHANMISCQGVDGGWDCYPPLEAWEIAKDKASHMSKAFAEAGYHKQITNRLTEPFQMIKVVVSATEWDNFFWLRDHEAADPTIAELARCMREAYNQSVPQLLEAGQWHLPYIDCSRQTSKRYYLNDEDIDTVSLEDAIRVSCARCAAVSFRNTDYDLEKSIQVYNRLVGEDRKHASALEHCATPVRCTSWDVDDGFGTNEIMFPRTWERGISHADRTGQLWSGNFKGFIQYRKLIDGENYNG